jgi:HD-GYP domain-containing protein (c-di-GMP phosphodiesterase class II)
MKQELAMTTVLEDTRYSTDIILSILQITEELNHLKDVDGILDKILLESRKLSDADAGTIFLVNDDSLKFSYVQNDTLFAKDESNAAVYSDYSMPINENSIVGYVAVTRRMLAIDDAYRLPPELPYAFNRSFDESSGYKTTSILTIPLKTFQDKLVGVLQLINAKNGNGGVAPFSQESKIYVPLFASQASVAIERGIMSRELILRMMKLAELRDPHETGAHVQRVGAYSAEIYHRLATKKGIDKKEIKRFKDMLRQAAMLHDVGKVGISDFILKKPGQLTEEERDTMKWHTVFGARLFSNTISDLDKMSAEIALNHHEKWEGGGYPGIVSNIMSDKAEMGIHKKGEEIPLTARITSLADVFDALSSRRSYKEPWTDEQILSEIEKDSGKHFDPEVVEAFFDNFEVIKAIRNKFKS